MINVTFITNGKRVTVQGNEGESLLEVATNNKIAINSPCEGNLACGQCHVIIDDASFRKLGEISEREQDILDFIPNVEETSRLACQVKLTKELDGIVVEIASF